MKVFNSIVTDGSMKPTGADHMVFENQQKFLHKNNIRAKDTTLLRLLYGGNNYCRYQTLSTSYKGDGMTRQSTLDVDALVTTQPNHAILLPLADCIGAVLHDPTKDVLMVSHLGRHNLEQNGGAESVNYLVKHHGVDPKNIKIWLSPAAGKASYPLFSFNNRGLHEVAVEQITSAGVPLQNIDVSPIDTTTDKNYFSHSQFLKGNRETDGRFCIVATMSNQPSVQP